MRVIAGPEKKTRVMSEKERRITAYHEMGHAIVGHYLEHSDPVHKISVIGRGQALGYTISMPTEDRFLTTRAELTDSMAMTLGGRAAEEIVFGEITTGASNDIEKVTATAKAMVMRYGMSERLGPRVFGHDQSQPFLGREFSSQADYSDEIAREIDDEIRRVVESAHQRAKDILAEHRETLNTVSEILVRRETIEKAEFEALIDGQAEEDVFPEEVADAADPAARDAASTRPAATPRARCPAPASPAASRPARTSRASPSSSPPGASFSARPRAKSSASTWSASRARGRRVPARTCCKHVVFLHAIPGTMDPCRRGCVDLVGPRPIRPTHPLTPGPPSSPPGWRACCRSASSAAAASTAMPSPCEFAMGGFIAFTAAYTPSATRASRCAGGFELPSSRAAPAPRWGGSPRPRTGRSSRGGSARSTSS